MTRPALIAALFFLMGLSLGWSGCGFYIYGGMVNGVVKVAEIREGK